ncbi:uncharacterized protein PFL1_05443 [Pseudozyma flocculosa PF-1]|uniref:Formin binding protein 3 n=1 Tax=Pseudozyma flocculosa PF-1 TaxID=1277687 RepID=A0A061H325_9BASI|nr:uncharacterized protein PFL1_05443 [Pseudozyma flocculosa PF-1]EPQ27162.1 hypothetical protein PFL1_05443 [Pseudozyma flocculosa PF-1]
MSAPPPPQLAPPSASVWVEYRNPQGRPYWYHTIDKRSVWDKPVELKTPRERALDSTPWREYKSGDRSYYVHAETKQSTWTLPPEVKQLLEQFGGGESTPSAAAAAAAPPLVGPNGSVTPHGGTPSLPAAARMGGASGGPGMASPMAHVASPLAPGFSAASPMHHQQHHPIDPAAGPVRPPPGYGAGPGYGPGGPAGVRPHGPPPGFSPPGPASTTMPVRPSPGFDAGHARSHQPAPAPAALDGRPGRPGGPFRGDQNSAEAAFISLLEQKKVDVDWTWEVTMRAIITEPLYKALKTIAERKNAFAKYIERLKRQRAEERAQRLEQLRPVFRAMVTGKDSRVKPYHSFATFKKLCGHQPGFREARDDDEARAAYDAVIREVQEAEAASQREIRHRNMDMLMSLLKTFEADVLTRWRDAHRTVLESDEYAQDAHLKTMDVADMLIVFDEHMNGIEKEATEAQRRQEAAQRRKERKNRDEYKKLLVELKERGELTTRSTWGQVFDKVKDDGRFLRLVGQAGSSPLDLFHDMVDDLDRLVERHIGAVQAQLAKTGNEVKQTTTYDEFASWLAPSGARSPPSSSSSSSSAAAAASSLPGEADLRVVFHHLHATVMQRLADERRRAERRRRHAIDDLRYAFKKIDAPPLDVDAPLDEVLPRLADLKEYRQLEGDREAVEVAWDREGQGAARGGDDESEEEEGQV